MSAPPKQTKISYKKGQTQVTYESNLDATEYYLYELSRAALRDVGRYVCLKFRENFYKHFKKEGKTYANKATSYSVIPGKKTTAPRVQVGLKKKQRYGFYAYFQEFGTSTGIPRLGLLSKTVQDSATISEIVKIESQYLSGLSDEAARLDALIDENDMNGDADGTN